MRKSFAALLWAFWGFTIAVIAVKIMKYGLAPLSHNTIGPLPNGPVGWLITIAVALTAIYAIYFHLIHPEKKD